MGRERLEGYNSDLANEVYKRLKQLSFLCNKIRLYQTYIMKIMPKAFASFTDARNARISRVHPTTASTKDFDVYTKLFFEMELFAESFYFVAWRIHSILRHKKDNLLPHLNSFEAKGVRDVRNSLIEHPEDSKIFMQSFACDSERGPVFKNARPEGDPYEISDQGLWPNANEFKRNLEKLLVAALGK